ncbi:MAG TPA: cyclic nucleotide-binding domain-containing protein [Bradyrhizobium sp.]
MRLKTGGRGIRLATFTAATVFGELALLDKGTCSASVVADEERVCHVLSDHDFDALSRTKWPSGVFTWQPLKRALSDVRACGVRSRPAPHRVSRTRSSR